MDFRHLEGRAANALERVGFTYSPLRMHQFHLQAQDDAQAVVGAMLDLVDGARVFADVGCGSGAFAAEINRRGFVAIGCEQSPTGRLLARAQGVDCRPFELGSVAVADRLSTLPAPLPVRYGHRAYFDVAYCFEVAEHVPTALSDALVAFLVRLSDVVIFTAAPPGQGGTGHINEQPPAFWIERFGSEGHHLDDAATSQLRERFAARGVEAHWFHDNALVFRRLSD